MLLYRKNWVSIALATGVLLVVRNSISRLNSLSGWGVCDAKGEATVGFTQVSIALAAGVSATLDLFGSTEAACLNSLSGWGVCDHLPLGVLIIHTVSIALAAGVSATTELPPPGQRPASQ